MSSCNCPDCSGPIEIDEALLSPNFIFQCPHCLEYWEATLKEDDPWWFLNQNAPGSDATTRRQDPDV